jgi:hypothetical protein
MSVWIWAWVMVMEERGWAPVSSAAPAPSSALLGKKAQLMVRSDNAAFPSDNRHPHYSHPPLVLFNMPPNDADGIHGAASPATYDGSAAASCVSSPGAASASSFSNETGRVRYNGRRECSTHCFSCMYPRFAAAVGCQVPDGVHRGLHRGLHRGTHHGRPHGTQ